MLITRKSPFSGKVTSQEIPVTKEQIAAWQNGVLIQVAMPNLDADQREFILTGINKEEWDNLMGSEE
jgi:hypothetical protein